MKKLRDKDNKDMPEASLEELEKIEGNYYKMDFFVAISLVFFTLFVYLSRDSLSWSIFLAVVSLLFFIRGFSNLGRRIREEKIETSQHIGEQKG